MWAVYVADVAFQSRLRTASRKQEVFPKWRRRCRENAENTPHVYAPAQCEPINLTMLFTGIRPVQIVDRTITDRQMADDVFQAALSE
jgi:hypothetical protein